MSHSLADEIRQGVARSIPGGVEPDEVSDDAAAFALGSKLMKGDPAVWKAGYTAENAALAALEIFPGADPAKLRAGLGALR